MFRANYMTDVWQVNVALCDKCNGVESYSNEKGYVLDMFCLWIVRSRIANLLSLSILEGDGYVCQYHTNSEWMVECPDGTILKFKRGKGLYKGFPFINMKNLKEHVFRPSSVAKNTSKSKVKPVENLGARPRP